MYYGARFYDGHPLPWKRNRLLETRGGGVHYRLCVARFSGLRRTAELPGSNQQQRYQHGQADLQGQ